MYIRVCVPKVCDWNPNMAYKDHFIYSSKYRKFDLATANHAIENESDSLMFN